jgi:hypothetical protein
MSASSPLVCGTRRPSIAVNVTEIERVYLEQYIVDNQLEQDRTWHHNEEPDAYSDEGGVDDRDDNSVYSGSAASNGSSQRGEVDEFETNQYQQDGPQHREVEEYSEYEMNQYEQDEGGYDYNDGEEYLNNVQEEEEAQRAVKPMRISNNGYVQQSPETGKVDTNPEHPNIRTSERR